MTARRWSLAWVLFALLCAQTLGFMHRVAHVPGATPPAAVFQEQAKSPQAGWLKSLFAHADDHGCRLLDGAGQCGAPLPPAAELPRLPVAQAAFALAAFAFVQRWPAHFQARAPPLSR